MIFKTFKIFHHIKTLENWIENEQTNLSDIHLHVTGNRYLMFNFHPTDKSTHAEAIPENIL